MTRYYGLRRALTCAAAVAALCSAAAGTAAAHNDKHRGSIDLKAQGSFYVGGELFTIPSRVASGTTPEPGIISINHAYVQYQIPEDKDYRYPILMVHGGGHTGKTYETTPDGREGWFTSFTRRGFSSYVFDDPNRGRACCEPTELHLVRMGLLPNTAIPNMNIYTKQAAWATFRFGPTYPDVYPGQRFPMAAMDQYAPQWVLTYRDAEENAKITNAIVAAIDKIGPVIVMVHSQSGPLGLAAVRTARRQGQGFRCDRAGGLRHSGSPDGSDAQEGADLRRLRRQRCPQRAGHKLADERANDHCRGQRHWRKRHGRAAADTRYPGQLPHDDDGQQQRADRRHHREMDQEERQARSRLIRIRGGGDPLRPVRGGSFIFASTPVRLEPRSCSPDAEPARRD